MRVIVVYAAPGVEAMETVDVPFGATLAAAVDASGLINRLGLDAKGLAFAIFGQRAMQDTLLREGDRIEVVRPLRADPKEVRRRRAQENPLPRPQPVARRQKNGNR